jgi:hypothetical protein
VKETLYITFCCYLSLIKIFPHEWVEMLGKTYVEDPTSANMRPTVASNITIIDALQLYCQLPSLGGLLLRLSHDARDSISILSAKE